MKGKTTIVCLAMSIAMLLTLLPSVRASPTAMQVIFELSGTTELTPPLSPTPGNTFIVDITIFEISALWSWKVKLTWDPELLEVVYNDVDLVWEVYEGGFLQPGTLFLFAPPNNDIGEITEMSCTRLTATGKTGSGILATVTFRVKKFTPIDGTYINLLSVVCKDPAKVDIPVDPIVPGHFVIPPPPPTAPKAEFIPEHCSFFFVGSTINLDAHDSLSGWDVLPESHECPITIYHWDIDVGNDLIIDFTLEGVTASFLCEAPGDVGITLTVTAPDPLPPADPRYVDHDSAKHVIHQIIKPVGPAIDVYTNKGGYGPGYDPDGDPYAYHAAWSDAYGPQEEVTIYALVTYNDEPVEYKPVAFEIKDPSTTTQDYRTAFTNANGIATTTFRIPWTGSAAEALFGDWSIIGTVSVSETTVKDICKFRFGYLVEITDVLVSGSPLKKGQDLGVTLDIMSIFFKTTGMDVFVTIVLHDECNVPINLQAFEFTVDPDDGLTSESTMTIPSWAFVGTGHVYANIYTKAPVAGGTPLCPESSNIFVILKTAP